MRMRRMMKAEEEEEAVVVVEDELNVYDPPWALPQEQYQSHLVLKTLNCFPRIIKK